MSNEACNQYILAGQPDGDDLDLYDIANWAGDEIVRLRKVLSYYADPNNYTYSRFTRIKPILLDNGYRARVALGDLHEIHELS